MIPEMIKTRGAVHLAGEDGSAVPGLDPPRRVLELVPGSVARENLVLPLSLDGETLTVAAADAGNLLLADKLSFLLNKKVKLVAAPRAAIVEAIGRHYGRFQTESVDSMLCEFTDTAVSWDAAAPAGASWGGAMPEMARTRSRGAVAAKKRAGLGDSLGTLYYRSRPPRRRSLSLVKTRPRTTGDLACGFTSSRRGSAPSWSAPTAAWK